MLNRATSESIPAFEPPALQPHLLRIANHEARLDVLKSRAQLYAEAGRFVLQRLWVEIWQRADQRCARAPAAPTSKSTTARPRTACPRKSPHKKNKSKCFVLHHHMQRMNAVSTCRNVHL